MEYYGEKIRISLTAIRVNANMNQQEWADALGVNKATVTNWESGKSYPNAIKLRRMSELSHIPMDFIFVPE